MVKLALKREARRCPFLQGVQGNRQFASTVSSEEQKFEYSCDLSGNMWNFLSNFPRLHGCINGEFAGCEYYSRQLLSLNVDVPLKRDPELADLPRSEYKSTGFSLLERLLMRLESIDGQLALIEDRIGEIFAVLEKKDGP